jgi:hypothetical protein
MQEEPDPKRICIRKSPKPMSRPEFLKALPLFKELYEIIKEWPWEVVGIVIEYIFQLYWEEQQNTWAAQERLVFKVHKSDEKEEQRKWCERQFMESSKCPGTLCVLYADSDGDRVDEDSKLYHGDFLSATIKETGEPELTDRGWVYPKGVEELDEDGRVIFRGESIFPLSGIACVRNTSGRVLCATQYKSNDKGQSERVIEEEFDADGQLSRRNVLSITDAFLEVNSKNLVYRDNNGVSVSISLSNSGLPETYRVFDGYRWFGVVRFYEERDFRYWKYIELSDPCEMHQFYGCNDRNDLWSVHAARGERVVTSPTNVVSPSFHHVREDSLEMVTLQSFHEREYWQRQLQFDLEHCPMPAVQLCLRELKSFQEAQKNKDLTLWGKFV